MHQKGTPWSPDEIRTMRRELLKEDKTLEEIGRREGVTRERIRQLVGNLERGNSRSKANQQRVRELTEAGLSDEMIAKEMGLSLGTVRNYRLVSGIIRPNPRKKWTPENVIEFAQKWFEEHGHLAATDWNPNLAQMYGHTERVKRFHESGAPRAVTAIQLFGSWNEMKRQAGLPLSPVGGSIAGRFGGHARPKNR